MCWLCDWPVTDLTRVQVPTDDGWKPAHRYCATMAILFGRGER